MLDSIEVRPRFIKEIKTKKFEMRIGMSFDKDSVW